MLVGKENTAMNSQQSPSSTKRPRFQLQKLSTWGISAFESSSKRESEDQNQAPVEIVDEETAAMRRAVEQLQQHVARTARRKARSTRPVQIIRRAMAKVCGGENVLQVRRIDCR